MQKLTSLAHKLVAEVIKPGSLAVDATAGNGLDTLFLAKAVGEKGLVTAMDIQSEAIWRTGELLKEKEAECEVRLIIDCHSELGRYVAPKTVDAVMFNLGFLPRSDRKIVTRKETTIKALSAAIECLAPGGILTTIAYRGHEGGLEESKAVSDFFEKLKSEGKRVNRFEEGGDPTSPMLFVTLDPSLR